MGTRSWSKGRLYRIKNHLDIGPANPYARVMECSTLGRQRFNARFPFRLVWALLTVMVCAAPPHLQGQAVSAAQACGGNSNGRCPGCKNSDQRASFSCPATGCRAVEQQRTDCGDDQLPVVGSAFGKADPHSEEAGISSKLWPDRNGSGAQCHSAPDGRMSFWQLHGAMAGNGEAWFREQAPGQWKIITINESASTP